MLAWEKQSNPYFLHGSENPGLILVNQSITEEKYATWSRAIIYAFDSKNKTDFVDGTIKAPTSSSDPISLLGRNATEWFFLG